MPGPGPSESFGSWAEAFALVAITMLAAVFAVILIAVATEHPRYEQPPHVNTGTAFT